MKYTFTIIALLACTLSFAQQSPNKRFSKLLKAKRSHSNEHKVGAASKTSAIFTRPGTSADYEWDDVNQVWDPVTNSQYRYTASGLRTSWTKYDLTNPNLILSIDSSTFDAQGNLTMSMQMEYDGTALVPTNRELMTYDAAGRVTEWKNQFYVTSFMAWMNDDRYTYSYDSFGNELLYTDEWWNGTSWVMDYGNRYTYTYGGPNGVMNEAVQEAYSANAGSTWQFVTKETYTFNANNEWSSLTYWGYNNGTWYLDDRAMNITWHNFAGLIPAGFIWQDWDLGAWVNSERDTYTVQGNDILVTLELWSNNGWVLDRRSRETYGPGGPYVYDESYSDIYEEWNGTSWDSVSRFQEVYNDFGEYLGQKDESYSNGIWVTDYDNLSELTYNTNGDLTQ